MTGWAIYACGTPYAVEVAEVIWRCGDEVALLVNNLPAVDRSVADAEAASAAIGVPLVRPEEVPAAPSLATVVPLITPGHRFAVETEARALGLTSFPLLVDPTSVVARTAALSEGTVVNGAAMIATTTEVGRFVHVNRSASIGHHNAIEDYATLGPGCVLAGHVTVGRGAFVGAGAVCAPNVSIGPNAVVGAGAVVVRDVPAGAVAVGNPAKTIRRGAGYGDVSVPG
jgi:sugar O-acyltransferase (sialic acid O-acetyltransferase NeuD family)